MPGVKAEKIREAIQKNRAEKDKLILKTITAMDAEQSFDSTNAQLGDFYEPYKSADNETDEGSYEYEHLRDAMLRRDWIALHNIHENLKKYVLNLQDDHDGIDVNASAAIIDYVVEVEEEKKEEEQKDGNESDEGEKDIAGKNSLPIISFSKVAITNIVKHVVLFLSLAESSDDASKLPFRVMKPGHLTQLIKLSVVASPSIQLLLQKVF
jgi:hypothetical protein